MENLYGKSVIFSGFYDESLRLALESRGAIFSESIHINNKGYLITNEHIDMLKHFSGKLKIGMMSKNISVVDRDSFEKMINVKL
tara:strand:+ start:118 stop:369 length:252 start_codon:yes stop_codon:yes gene_type:complete